MRPILTDEERATRKKASAAKAKAKYRASEKGKSKEREYNRQYKSEHSEELKPRAREYAAQYRKDNTEKVRVAQLAWRKEHREESKQRSAEWHQDNPDRVRARNVAKYVATRGQQIAAVIAWQKANPHKVKIRAHNYWARKKAGGGRLSAGLVDLLLLEQGGKCAYCDDDLAIVGKHLDHVMPLKLGGKNEDSNMQLTCPSCNCRKRHTHPVEFLKRFAPC